MDTDRRGKQPSARARRAPAAARLAALRTRLARAIPTPRCELDHASPWQLLVATILSAQSTDRMVNRVSKELFQRWPGPQELAAASRGDVEQVVKSTGFFRSKAKAIQNASAILAAEHQGLVPPDLEALLALPGVARKTANVVLGTAFGLATGIVVDTHAARVAQRLRLTEHEHPAKIEPDLCAAFPRRSWVDTSHRLVLHGRYVCRARAPRCAACPLNELCPAREQPPQGVWTARARAEQRLVESRGEANEANAS